MNAVIIGSGIAGIATSIRLACLGIQVNVYEANAYPGGKLTAINQGEYRFDAGPSLFTMPQFVDELFELAGARPSDHFEYTKLGVACKYFYEDQTQITAYTNIDQFCGEIESKLDHPSQEVKNYLTECATLYDVTSSIFLEKSLHRLESYWSTDVLKALFYIHRLNLTRSMNQVNVRKLSHPKLVQLFNRFATYNGSNPYTAPGVLNMIPHLEHNIGTFYPKGGMHSITQSLVKLAENLGVTFHYNHRVTEIVIVEGQAIGIRHDQSPHTILADWVVSNMDIVPTYRYLLPKQPQPERTLQQERSSSALIFYWGITQTFPELELHNIFFSEDYQTEFNHIFKTKTVYHDPTIYVNISSKEDSNDAPEGCENWFVMINVPHNIGQNWDEIIVQAREQILQKLSRMLCVNLRSLIESESILEPRSIETRTSSYLGALYGASSNNRFAAFLRHPNFSYKIPQLYFVGGSVHPGGGIPLCLLSAKITADIIRKKHSLSYTYQLTKNEQSQHEHIPY